MTTGDSVPRGVLLLVLLFLLWGGCSAERQTGQLPTRKPTTSSPADVHAINSLLSQWVELYNAGAYEALASAFYVEDAVLMSPNAPTRKGREAILRGFRAEAELNDEHCDSSAAEEVRVSGDLAIALGTDTGTTTPKTGGTPVNYSVKWMMAFERQAGGNWKCVYEIWYENVVPQVLKGKLGLKP